VAVPNSKLWECDPHTLAKHQILERYLQAWFPIIARKYPSLTYAEGFAGPNEYEGGEPGSPTYALRQSQRPDVAGRGTSLRYVFVEQRQDRFEHLKVTIETQCPTDRRSPKLLVRCIHGDCEKDLLPALGSAHAWGQPIFANLDGFGADVPFSVVERIGANQNSEVLVTVAPSFFVRFANVKDVQAGDRVFGNDEWRAVQCCASPDDKRRFLIDHYRSALRRAGFKWMLHFEMVDEGGHELYLFFATTVELGVEKMKDSMWKTDSRLGQRFRDPRNPGQLSFAIDSPDLSSLSADVVAFLKVNGPSTVAALRRFAVLESLFRKPHASAVVTQLRDAGVVTVEPKRVADSSIVTLLV
jgi:three-Cys-motif partner protein